MNPDATLCISATDLARFLENQMTCAAEASVVAHLDGCEACRQRLETLAADADDWKQAASCLSSDLPAPNEESRRVGGPSELWDDQLDPAFDILAYLAPTDDPQMLGRLGPYEIVGVVGRGGMGVVLKGYDRPLNRFVAIKVLSPALALSAAARQRFAREARAAAAVVHEHVIAIHSVSEHRGLPYLVMPYLSGPSLARRIEKHGVLGVLEVLRISRQVALGLAAAHGQGLVHRDVKPANILLESDVERITITDFGLARAIDDVSITQPGVIAGTPQYMSPEQSRGEAVDHRSDLFSLGSVMYAMCAGVPPFRGDMTVTVLRRICDEEPRPLRELNPEVPQWLAETIAKLHRKAPGDRFQSAGELAAVLEAWLVHLQQPAHCPAPRQSAARRQSRVLSARSACLGGLAALLLAVAGIGGALLDGLSGLPADETANASPLTFQRAPLSIPPTGEGVRALSFSPDGQLLVVAHGNQNSMSNPGPGSVQVWNVPERKLLTTLPEARGVNTIAISPDGRRAAYGTFEQLVKVIELPRGREIHRCQTEQGGAGVAFSPDGTLLAIATPPRLVELWEVETWTRREVDFQGDLFTYLSVAFSPDGSMVAAGGGIFPPQAISGQAYVWDVASGQRVIAVKAGAAFMHVEFSPDGRHLATASLDTRATLWDLSSGEPAHSYRDPESGLVRLRLMDNGSTIATLGPGSGIKLFAAGSDAPHARMKLGDANVDTMNVTADGQLIASGGRDRLVRLWDTRTHEPVAVLGPTSDADVPLQPIVSIAGSPDEKWLALGREDGSIVLRDAEGAFVRTLTGHEDQVAALAFLADGRTLISGSYDNTIRIWNVEMGQTERTIAGHHNWVMSLAVSPDGSRLASGSYDRRVRVFDLGTGQMLGQWQAHDASVRTVAFSPDGTRLLTGGSDGLAKIWDATSHELLLTYDGHKRPIRAAAFSPDGATIATGSEDGRMLLCSAQTGFDRRALGGHQGMVWALAFSNDGKTIISGGEDRMVRVWDAETLDQRQSLPAHGGAVTAIAVLPKTSRLVSVSLDQSLKIWTPDSASDDGGSRTMIDR